MTTIKQKKFFPVPARKNHYEKTTEVKIADSYLKKMKEEEVITEFPCLVRGGQLINAIKTIQGHDRYVCLYSFLEKSVRHLFCKKTAVNKEKLGIQSILR